MLVGVFVGVCVGVRVGVAVGVGVLVAVEVFVGVLVDVAVTVGVAVLVGVPVAVAVFVGVLVGDGVAVFVGVLVDVLVGVTVVTDLVTTHTTWFCTQASLIVVPTENAHKVGLKCGISPERMKVVGLPVAEEFNQRNCDPREIRTCLDWPLDDPVVLLMGGGEGVGRLEAIATAIDKASLPVTLVIVAGRNKALKQRLEGRSWKTPIRVYGFVQAMPDFMQAASILLTKAGPGTISEAIISGLPVILYDRLNGPEDGNVRYIVDHGAGIWAPRADLVVANVIRWLDHPDECAQAASACLALARPQAAREIAALIMAQIQGNV